MLSDLIRHKEMSGYLFLHPRSLPLILAGGVLHLLALFRFLQHIQRTVHLTLYGINQARVFLEFPRPIVHHAETVL